MTAPFNRDVYYPLRAFAFEQITVSTTSVPFTAATVSPAGAERAIAAHVQVESAALRHRIDADPTATAGHFAEPGDEFWVWGTPDVDSIEFIRRDGVNAQINVTYYR